MGQGLFRVRWLVSSSKACLCTLQPKEAWETPEDPLRSSCGHLEGCGGGAWGRGQVLRREGSYHQWRERRLWVVPSEVGFPSPHQSETAQKSEEVGRGQTGFQVRQNQGVVPQKAERALAEARQALAGQNRVLLLISFCSALGFSSS